MKQRQFLKLGLHRGPNTGCRQFDLCGLRYPQANI